MNYDLLNFGRLFNEREIKQFGQKHLTGALKTLSDRIKKIENIHLNSWGTDNWDDISYIENIEHYLEYIMRILPMAKMP